jgi:hypothetical protein
MKALITESGQFGPFTSITQTADRWVCDGAEFQFSVIGDATVGEYVAPPPPPPPVPPQVTMRQARLALHSAGLLAGVDAAIASLEEPAKTATAIEWEYAQTVDRASGLVPQMAVALGMTEAQVDDLFRLAVTL